MRSQWGRYNLPRYIHIIFVYLCIYIYMCEIFLHVPWNFKINNQHIFKSVPYSFIAFLLMLNIDEKTRYLHGFVHRASWGFHRCFTLFPGTVMIYTGLKLPFRSLIKPTKDEPVGWMMHNCGFMAHPIAKLQDRKVPTAHFWWGWGLFLEFAIYYPLVN